MLTNFKIYLYSFVVMFSIACSPDIYMSDSLGDDHRVDFNTYAVEGDCDQDINRIMGLRIKNAIDLTMRENNYKRSDNPDILIQYFVKKNEKFYMQPCAFYDKWERGSYCEGLVIKYEEGTVVIDFIDAKTNTIFWHGAVNTTSFDKIKNPDKKINNIVRTLLEKEYFDVN